MLAFYLFARQDDPHSGLAVVDPLFAAWQAHLAANPVEGEVLFIRLMRQGPMKSIRLAVPLASLT